MAPSDQLTDHVAGLRKLVSGTRPDQMTNPTPCAKWTVHDLCNHVVGGAHMFASAFRGQTPEIDADAPAPDLVGDDAASAFAAAIADFNSAVDSPGAMDRNITLPFATLPAPVTLEILKFDLLVHSWDLAAATGQQFTPPDDVVEQASQTAQMIIAPEARDGDTFAAEQTAGANSTPIEKLAAFAGRQVG